MSDRGEIAPCQGRARGGNRCYMPSWSPLATGALLELARGNFDRAQWPRLSNPSVHLVPAMLSSMAAVNQAAY